MKGIRKVLGICVVTSVVAASAFTLAGLIFPRQILGLFSKDAAVVAMGSSYLRIIVLSYIVTAVTFSYSIVLRSTGNAKVPMFVSLIALSINTVLNYLLVYGYLGFPKLGTQGSAIATTIARFVEEYNIQDGIMHACVKKNVPFVLTGSIRDDGPLPEVIADVYKGQDAMRALVSRATTVICMATQLHTIATGNMTPSFRVKDGVVRPVFLYTVDISEFAVNKLRDRGSLAVTSLIANAQDFLVHVMRGIQKEE
jgi:uncharacterized membrane protein